MRELHIQAPEVVKFIIFIEIYKKKSMRKCHDGAE